MHRLNVNDRIRPGGADALARHFRAHDNVAVATACADVFAQPLCREIDPRVHVVASTLRRRVGGLFADRHCHGDRKVEMLIESGVEGEIAAGYGNSASDGPMLDLARTAFLVNLSERTANELRRQLTGPDRVHSAHWPP